MKGDLYGVTVAEAPGQLGGVFDYVLWSMGGAWADENWNVTIDSAETRAALKHMYEQKKLMDPGNLTWDIKESSKAFLDGKAAVCTPVVILEMIGNAFVAHRWRIKSLLFSTDVAVIKNSNADSVMAVYPFTPQLSITNAIISSASVPVFVGVGGGLTSGERTLQIAGRKRCRPGSPTGRYYEAHVCYRA